MIWLPVSLRKAIALGLTFAAAVVSQGASAAAIGQIDQISLGGTAKILPVVARVTYPRLRGQRPVIVFSHGNFLSRQDYRPLVEAWARAGFVVVQPDHPDAATGGDRPRVPLDNWSQRIAQLKLTIDRLDRIDAVLAPMRLVTDRSAIIVAGHSFGAHSAAALMGMAVWDVNSSLWRGFDDSRVRGALLLAPPGHASGLQPEWKTRASYLNTDWRNMRGPTMIVNGAEDVSPMAVDAGAVWHNDPFEHSRGDGICLLMAPGADHYLYGISRSLGDARAVDVVGRERLAAMTVDFLKAAISGQPSRQVAKLSSRANRRFARHVKCH